MANTNINPYGQGATMPAGYPIANDLDTNDAQKSLSAAMGYKLARTHWNGKKWYGFGTSITNTSNEGKYPTYLAQLSGMTFVNHGKSGGGIMSSGNHSIYDDIMVQTASTLADADLITIEVGANDSGPLGTVYDGLTGSTVTDNSTFCGALNICIRHLQSVSNAQIVVICSPHGRYQYGNPSSPLYGNGKYGSDNHSTFDRDEIMRKVCMLNSVYYIPAGAMDGMGYARMNASNAYNVDNIHQTNLGGYNFAQAIWSQLKNIPLFFTAVQIPFRNFAFRREGTYTQ